MKKWNPCASIKIPAMADTKLNLPARLLRKRWPDDLVEKYIGEFNGSWFAYAADETIRANAASGGVATALLKHMLESGQIDGALVCRSVVQDGHVEPVFEIATDAAALFRAQGSKYCAVDFNQQALPLMRGFNGRLAVTALPCDSANLRQACARDPELAQKIGLVITLFCGHNSLPDLTDMVVRKLTPDGGQLAGFRYRQGYWRGQLRAEFDDGAIIEKPFSYFSDYQNLYFFCQQKCHHCHDHTGYTGDLSLGDIWSLRMKDNPVKHNAVITRTPAGDKAFSGAVAAGAIEAFQEDIAEICEGQARSLPFHYNLSARAKAGQLLGMRIKDSVQQKVRWNDYLAALIVLGNEKFSRSRLGRKLIRRIPRFMLRLYLYLLKGLESL
jgi:coenzyme F420-reducing hydrogenase beta subunit